jgi:hypothetical protein
MRLVSKLDVRAERFPQLKVHLMQDDDEFTADGNSCRANAKDVAVLPAQLGHKLRTLFANVEAQPVPDRLVELLEALAAKEKKRT